MDVYAGNDHAIYLTGARTINLATGAVVSLPGTASVVFRVQTRDYVDVPGTSWPITMQYVAGSQGDFVGVLPASVLLQPGTSYRFVGTADNGPNQHGAWDMPLHASLRE